MAAIQKAIGKDLPLFGCYCAGEIGPLDPVMKRLLNDIVDDFSPDDAARIKAIEATTNHDVKAVEYFLRERIGAGDDVGTLIDFIHFGCTSEDINNLAYALMLREGRNQILLPQLDEIIDAIRRLAHDYSDVPMLSHTHGQPASPTTVGKEMANVVYRLHRQREQIAATSLQGKINGAVGNYNAHLVAYPDINWEAQAKKFVDEEEGN